MRGELHRSGTCGAWVAELRDHAAVDELVDPGPEYTLPRKRARALQQALRTKTPLRRRKGEGLRARSPRAAAARPARYGRHRRLQSAMTLAQMPNAVTARMPKAATRAYTDERSGRISRRPMRRAQAGLTLARRAGAGSRSTERRKRTPSSPRARAGRLTAPLCQNIAPSGRPSAGVAASGDTPRRAGSTLECAAAAFDDIVLVRPRGRSRAAGGPALRSSRR